MLSYSYTSNEACLIISKRIALFSPLLPAICWNKDNVSCDYDVLCSLGFCVPSQQEDEMVDYFRRKYAEVSAAERFGEGERMSDEITQQGLLPGVK